VLLAPDAPGELVLVEDPHRVTGERDEQLELKWAQTHDRPCDLDGARGQVDVHARNVQGAAGDGLDGAPPYRRQDRPQQRIARRLRQVVVAAALVGPQDGQLVAGAERDDRLARIDPRVLAVT
jgi:hypothetical protein